MQKKGIAGTNGYRMARSMAIALLLLALAAASSGCICCCGMDSLLSRMKKPVSAIALPQELTIGDKSYSLLYSYDYLNRTAAKEGFKAFIPRIGYYPEEYGHSVDQMMDVGGVGEYKWFEYTDGSGRVRLGGFLAKAGSPLTVDYGHRSLVTMMHASMPTINDPRLNDGGAQNVTHNGTAAIGDGADLYRFDADYNGSQGPCYFVIAKHSNMYIAIYSFESFEAAENVAIQAVRWIDAAAASP